MTFAQLRQAAVRRNLLVVNTVRNNKKMNTTTYLEERTQDLNELLALVGEGRIKKMVVTVLDDADCVHQMEIKSQEVRAPD